NSFVPRSIETAHPSKASSWFGCGLPGSRPRARTRLGQPLETARLTRERQKSVAKHEGAGPLRRIMVVVRSRSPVLTRLHRWTACVTLIWSAPAGAADCPTELTGVESDPW